MRKMNEYFFVGRVLFFLLSGLMITAAYASVPLWTFEPLTSTTLTVPENGAAIVQYRITNQSSKPHALIMKPIQGITQITTGLGVCGARFELRSKNSCILSLQINGNQLVRPITDGPVVCNQGNINQCYRPEAANILRIIQNPAITEAQITVTGSPLTLTASGPSAQLTITNTSLDLAATNVISNFTGTALDGNVTETASTCANISPASSCILTYTPGNTVVPQTNFIIQGTNTNALSAAMAIQSGITLIAINPASGAASGGTGFTLTGTGLTGATGIAFDGVAASNVNVINSTTVTGVTPSHAAGVVDVVINTPSGSAMLANGYTYVATAVGQSSGGGTIACLNGGLNNLIAALTSSSRVWGGLGTAIGAGAQSITDGASNTAAIVTALGNNGGTPYAAQLCNDFEVDSQGNTPCQVGNNCYDDWFLPAGNNTTATGQLNCLFTNRIAIGGFAGGDYWSSTESSAVPQDNAFAQFFGTGLELVGGKDSALFVRCVRAFTP